MNVLAYEVERLRTLRSTWVVVLGCLGVSLGTCLLLGWTGTSVAGAGTSVSGREMFVLTVTKSSAAPWAAALLGVLAVADERRTSALGLSLWIEPRRWVLLAARCLVVTASAMLLAWATLVVNATAARFVFGVDPLLLGTDTAVAAGWFTLACAAWACAGVGVAGLLRSRAAALMVVLLMPAVVGRAGSVLAPEVPVRIRDMARALDPFALLTGWRHGVEVSAPAVLGAASAPHVVGLCVVLGWLMVLAWAAGRRFSQERVQAMEV